MSDKFVLRGDVWSVDLGRIVGSEQGGVRGCLVIQNDVGNQFSPTVTIIPITSKNKNFSRTHVEIMLREKSYIICEQIRTIDKKRLINRIGRVNNDVMLEVEDKVKLHLGIV